MDLHVRACLGVSMYTCLYNSTLISACTAPPITKNSFSPTLRCVLQLRIRCPQWPVLNGVKG